MYKNNHDEGQYDNWEMSYNKHELSDLVGALHYNDSYHLWLHVRDLRISLDMVTQFGTCNTYIYLNQLLLTQVILWQTWEKGVTCEE